MTWTGTQDLGGVLLFDPSEEGQDQDGYSWDVKRRGGKMKQLWPVKERREGRREQRRDRGREVEWRQGQGWSTDREAMEGGKVPALGRSQRFEDLDVCESGVRPVGSLIQRLRGDGYKYQARPGQGF